MTASPCIGVCQLDGRTQICIGCGRTINEIAHWMRFSDSERRAIVARIERSRKTAAPSYDG